MKRFILFTMIVLLGMGTIMAQDSSPQQKRDQSKADKLEHLKTELNLTDDQVEQLKTVFETHKTKAQEIKANTALSDDERREAMKDLHQVRMGEIENILSDEQMEKFKVMRKQHREDGHKGQYKQMQPSPGVSPNGSKQ